MCFLIKTKFDDDKKSHLYDRFLVSYRNFTTENVYIINNSRFLDQNSRFFSKISQIQGFTRLFLPKLWNSRFPGKVATL